VEMTAIRCMIRDYEAAGLFSEAYFKQKQTLLEVWSCPTLKASYQAALSFLNHFRSQKPPIIPRPPSIPPNTGGEAGAVPVLNASICASAHTQKEAWWAFDETRGEVAARRGEVVPEPCRRLAPAACAHKVFLCSLEQRAQAF